MLIIHNIATRVLVEQSQPLAFNPDPRLVSCNHVLSEMKAVPVGSNRASNRDFKFTNLLFSC